ncbi:hypothetical protein SG34_005020 [Thalassomonas viridans]|uniref:Uncharacterized protein n=1 Tax=Thalassomonas viridans TaxID=137584 RepID=A0AAE9Z584_9GAMM|nr:hypothetical protein [Thalassomonas viridans]WDE06289.1 hypothetical protein SG34_005020 [Thalassomonas viridans]
MDVQLASYIPLIFAAVMVVMVLGFAFLEKSLKAKVISRLYKNAPFYQAHQLLQQYHHTVSNGTRVDELDLINEKIGRYFNSPQQLSSDIQGQETLTSEQYQQFAQAHRILLKQINFINTDMSAKQRIMVNTQIKIDCLNYAETYCNPAEESIIDHAAHSSMASTIAKMP